MLFIWRNLGLQCGRGCDIIDVEIDEKEKGRMKKLLCGSCIALAIFCISASAALAAESGKCGDDLTWVLDDNGTLTISGTGEMDNYYANRSPWSYNNEITSLVIEDGVTSVGNQAFACCFELINVSLPDTLKSIGREAFYDCAFSEIEVPDGVESIGNRAFAGCDALTNIYMPDSVTGIGDGAFANCQALTNISLSDSVTYIGSETFSYCRSLAEITLPKSITRIEDSTFSDCVSLKNINIHDGIESIGQYAFYGCTELEGIYVSDDNEHYADLDGVLFTKDMTELILYPIAKTDLNYVIPDGVKVIDTAAFQGCTAIKHVTIPVGIKSISESTFEGCTGLETVDMPAGLETIGARAFRSCKELKSIKIPNNVVDIGEMAFWGTDIYYDTSNWDNGVLYIDNCLIDVQNVSGEYTVREGTRLVADVAFGYNKEISSIKLPEGLEVIGINAFQSCSGLQHIDIPSSIKKIGGGAFVGCDITEFNIEDNAYYTVSDGVIFTKDMTELTAYPAGRQYTEYIVPDSVTRIGDYAFSYCGELNRIELPDGLESIDAGAFYYCTGMTGIDLPKGVSYIGERAFMGCSGLKTIILPDGIENIEGSAFAYCSALYSVKLPEGLKSIGDSSFTDCVSLRSIKIPDGATDIGGHAFAKCRELSSIILPRSLKSIGYRAFYNLLSNIYYEGSETEWHDVELSNADDVLSNALTKATVHFNSTGPKPAIVAATAEHNIVDIMLSDVLYPIDVTVAAYDINGCLVEITGATVYAGDTDISVPVNEDAAVAKVMIWEDMTGMEPLCAAAEIDTARQ